jgi:adsorption protein B
MILRLTQRITWVGLTYGSVPAILSVPRLLIGNVLNGLATFRALKVFADSRSGKAAVRWDNTQHLEGVGDMQGAEPVRSATTADDYPLSEILDGLISEDLDERVKALRHVPAAADPLERAEVVAYLRTMVSSRELRLRAALAQTLGRLPWSELTPTLFRVLNDDDWVVRSNAARALLERPRLGALLEQAFTAGSAKVIRTLIRVIEQDRRRQREIFDLIGREQLTVTKATLMVESPILRKRYMKYVEDMTPEPPVAFTP